MKNLKSIILMLIVAALPVLAFAQAAEEDLDHKYATNLLKQGDTAPDFALPSLDGKTTVRLSDYRGKYVVLDFWASWCGDCRKDMPAIVKMHKECKGKNVEFVGVSFDTNREAWKKFVQSQGVEYTQAGELKKWKESQISKDYKVQWLPTMYVIDPEGKVVFGTVVSDKVKIFLNVVK